ncbi:ribosomal protein S5 domain 2-type protein [Dichotomocladium elegans]|nr:ribosomal protein S5 domain 2-type protein [Dichotomocladium elegans]
MSNTTVVSAPGKVLIAGGYLVLDQAYRGLVVGTTSRFYTIIRQGNEPYRIHVRSPQFESDNHWIYSAALHCPETLTFSSESVPRNKFVETSLLFSLKVLVEKRISSLAAVLAQGLDITIVGDNDFYSQQAQLAARNLPNTVAALETLEPFCDIHATLKTVHKTGLGSSAALTTSLVAALFCHLGSGEVSLDADRALIHNVAQFVHCYAQGKVGSGFDVSAAVYGNHRYTRFNPAALTHIMREDVDNKTLAAALDPSTSSWDNVVVPFQLPPGLELILGDVDAGSHTPTLVSKVLAWRKSKPEEATRLWDDLGGMNAKVEQHLRDLGVMAKADPQVYHGALKQCATVKASEWYAIHNASAIVKKLADLASDFGHVRAYLQKMSQLADVPIEPEEQTRLLNACMDVAGVIMAGVPGAGGYDAIFCIVLSEQAKLSVRQIWEEWKEMNVGPLLAQADDKGATAVALNAVPGLARVVE